MIHLEAGEMVKLQGFYLFYHPCGLFRDCLALVDMVQVSSPSNLRTILQSSYHTEGLGSLHDTPIHFGRFAPFSTARRTLPRRDVHFARHPTPKHVMKHVSPLRALGEVTVPVRFALASRVPVRAPTTSCAGRPASPASTLKPHVSMTMTSLSRWWRNARPATLVWLLLLHCTMVDKENIEDFNPARFFGLHS